MSEAITLKTLERKNKMLNLNLLNNYTKEEIIKAIKELERIYCNVVDITMSKAIWTTYQTKLDAIDDLLLYLERDKTKKDFERIKNL